MNAVGLAVERPSLLPLPHTDTLVRRRGFGVLGCLGVGLLGAEGVWVFGWWRVGPVGRWGGGVVGWWGLTSPSLYGGRPSGESMFWLGPTLLLWPEYLKMEGM